MQITPASIQKSEPFQLGSLIWVRNNGHFIKYILISVFQGLKRFEIQDINIPQKRFYVEEKHCYNIDPALNQSQSSHLNIRQLPSLSILNEPNILEALSQQYHNSIIYSRMGEVLISLNPFQQMPHLYSKAIEQMYSNSKLILKCPPHPFSVAQKAFRALRNQSGEEQRKVQSIIVTGISGSGKTENTKLIINYLVSRTSKSQSQLSKILLLVNPILEAFGNAQSANNDNSSRFGKLIKIYYEEIMGQMQITGARVETSLLERFRVSSLNSDTERNFHIFYLIASQNSQLQGLKYIKNCNFSSRQKARMVQKLQQLKDAMSEIGMLSKLQMQIFAIVQGISWLGEIEFLDSSDEGMDKQNIDGNKFQELKSNSGVIEDSTIIKSITPIQRAAQSLQLDYKELQNYLLQTQMSVGRKNVQIIKKKRHILGSIAARDALAKQLYLRLFQRIVEQINKSLITVCQNSFRSMIGRQKDLQCIQSKYYYASNITSPGYLWVLRFGQKLS